MSKLMDLTNQRFGFWVVKKRGENNAKGQLQWLCKCDCGTKRLVTSNSLRTGNSTSCGCNHSPNLVGMKFGNLKVLTLAQSDDKSRRYWNCECSCGVIVVATTYQLREKIVKSCKGCLMNMVSGKISTGNKLGETLCESVSSLYEEIRKGQEMLLGLKKKLESINLTEMDGYH